MSYELYQTNAIVLAICPRGESDVRIRMFTKAFGMLSVYAKGIRLEKSKLRGNVELFSSTRVSFVAGKEQYRLISAEMQNPYRLIRTDINRFRAISGVSRIMTSVIIGEEKDVRIWNLLIKAYDAIQSDAYNSKMFSSLLSIFQIKLIVILGYMPEKRLPIINTLYTATSLLPTFILSKQDTEDIKLFLQNIYSYAGVLTHNQTT